MTLATTLLQLKSQNFEKEAKLIEFPSSLPFNPWPTAV